ncbi:unnamed protein product [Callosobruchus maculatus]|uniref:Ionotropic glutamate receptor C-terminal domain-containing protein n=1 Tax=Callosobruchus maculatus TaxID=64391 RepID=A0A653DUT3_CALMS|nr:unnamed protein product [Callosobruchus maculatus]
MSFIISVVLSSLFINGCKSESVQQKQIYKIGGIFSNVDHGIAFEIAAFSANNKYPWSEIELVPSTHNVKYHDALKAYSTTCDLLRDGLAGLFGPSSDFSSTYIQSICDAKEIPHIETHCNFNIKRNDSLVNLHPHPKSLSNLFLDIVEAYGWQKIVIMYDNDDSLLGVRTLLGLNKKEKIVVIKQLETQDSGNFRPALTTIKATGNTEFVLACSMDIMEDVLKQLQQVGMMTDIYSYIITNLDVQTLDLSPYQYAGTNITLKTVKGLTGLVKFDIEGFRTDFNVDIMELSQGGLINVGQWNSLRRSLNTYRPEKISTRIGADDLFNRTFTVIITISQPYGMLTETTTQLVGNDRFEGFCIDVIRELSSILGFNYTFVIQDDGANGVFNPTTGQWNGMIREVMEGRADLAITDLTVTSERETAVDFTMPFMNLGISILYKKPEPVPPSLFMFVSPFSAMVWIMLGVSYFIVSICIFIMGRLAPAEWQNPYPCVEEPEFLVNQFSIRNALWFTMGALMQQGSELAPISISTRAASGVWWLFVLIMVSSYTANLAAFLTVETLMTSFKDIEELASQNEIKFGAKKGGATANYFRDSNLSIYQKVWSYMVHHPELMVDTNEEGVRRVENENYAFLMESTTIEYVTERHCSLAQVGGLLDDKGYAIAMKKESPYRNGLSKAVLQMQERGILTGLKIKWWKEKRGGGNCAAKSEGSEATPLDLQNVGGVFLVLTIGTILGIFGSFAELAWHIHQKFYKPA